ncbi:chlorinating enzyme [Actinomadura sp. 9N215]|uniref:chlorinating enzyme n=1 Tax=Actinomadura sp. 9N215 TaxID=3375150 RepID=UPI0037B0E68E
MTVRETVTERKFALNDEELAFFKANGYFGPFKVYEVEEAKRLWRRERLRLLDRSHAIYNDERAQAGNTNIANYDRHLDSDALADHISRPEIVDRVSSVFGPDLLCWRTEFFPKYPGDEGTDWHQADTFANASGKPQIVWPDELKEYGGTLTVWTAFTEVNQDTACLQFIPGTHEQMVYDEDKTMRYDPEAINSTEKGGMKRGFFGYDYRDLLIDPDFEPDEARAVPMIMRPGEAIMFSSTLMHASYPHAGKTDEMRMAFASRYVPTCVRLYPDTDVIEEYGGSVPLDRYGAVLVSGVDAYGHNPIATTTTRGRPFHTR